MDPKFEERPLPGGDDRKSGDHEDEIEHVSPIERIVGEMLGKGDQNTVPGMDDVKEDCDRPYGNIPGKHRLKQQVTEKNAGDQDRRQNLAGFFIGQAGMANERRQNDRGRDQLKQSQA